MRNAGNKMQSRIARPLARANVRAAIDRRAVYTRMQRDDGHLVYMEISDWHSPLQRCDIRRAFKDEREALSGRRRVFGW